MGYNTDEAVYSGQAAAIAGVNGLKDIFPIFRAHPLLFQFMLSILYRIQFSDLYRTSVSGGDWDQHNFPGLSDWKDPLRPAGRCIGGGIHRVDAIPHHRFTSGTVGWADDVLRHPDPLHADQVWQARSDLPGCMPPAHRWV